MSEPQLIDGVIETVITDEALHLAHKAAEPVIDEVVSTGLSKSVQEAFKLAKKASTAQNARSCRMVSEMRRQREHAPIDEDCSTLCGQTNIFQF